MPGRYPTAPQRRILWNALTGLAIVVLGTILVGFIILIGNVLSYLQPVLVPLAVAGILAYLLNPVVERLEERGFGRLRSIFAVFALVGVLFALGTALIVPKVAWQTGQLIENREKIGTDLLSTVNDQEWLRPLLSHWTARHPDFISDPPSTAPLATPPDPPQAVVPVEEWSFYKWASSFKDWIPGKSVQPEEIGLEEIPFKERRIGVLIDENFDGIMTTGWEWLRGGAGKVLGFFGYSLGFLLVPVYLFFFLRESAVIKERWSDFVPLKESVFKKEVVATVGEMNEYIIAFFRGQVVVSLIDGILTGILLWMLGLPYAVVIGIALAFLGVMPFVGFLVTLIPALIIAAVTWGDWQHPLAVFVIFFVVQQLDGIFIQPKIIGDKVGLHPMTIIFSIFFWSLILGGFLGALLAIPLTASVKVLFRRYLWDPALHPTSECESPDPAPDPPPDAELV